jgi:SAM-dependent methyltransferase
MDRTRFSALAHRDHALCSPISEAKLDRLIALLDLREGARVLDIGCGKGELLVRILEKVRVRAVGIDRSSSLLDEGRRAAARRVPDGDLTLIDGDARAHAFEPASFEVVASLGCGAFGGLRATLGAIAPLLRARGRVLIGDGYWKREPDEDYLAHLGASRDELEAHAGNVAAGIAEGFALEYATTSNDDEWDHYEGLYLRAIERFAAEHPDDPDHDVMLSRIRGWRDAYYRWGRDTLGFGVYLFRA